MMVYRYTRSKFSDQLFYKKIDFAVVNHSNGIFDVRIRPYFNYSSKYHIYLPVEKDNNRTIFLTMKSNNDIVDFNNLNFYNKFFISLSHNGRKFMIFNENMDGIILKS